MEHNGKRIGVLDNFAKACAVETTQSFTTAQVNEVQWASELFLLANSHISYTCIPKTVGIHASYMKDYSGKPMLLYDLQSDIDRYQTLDQVISAGPGGEGYLLPILISTATALRELHSNGYVHNQVFPDNIKVVEHNGKRIGVLDNSPKACAVQTTRSFTTAQVNEVQSWASELCGT